MEEMPFEQNDEGISYVVPKLDCHQMIILEV